MTVPKKRNRIKAAKLQKESRVGPKQVLVVRSTNITKRTTKKRNEEVGHQEHEKKERD